MLYASLRFEEPDYRGTAGLIGVPSWAGASGGRKTLTDRLIGNMTAMADITVTAAPTAPSSAEVPDLLDPGFYVDIDAMHNALRPLRHDHPVAVSYTHLRAHETRHDLVCRLLLEKK